jgi:hypothetical protein
MDVESMPQKERKILERKHEVFLKNVVDEFTDIINKVK